jgi:hypothetical protein
MDELWDQTKGSLRAGRAAAEEVHQADRLQRHPPYRRFVEDGFTKEEWKMMAETQKILDPAIKLVATCVRVPVMVGHAEAVNIEFETPLDEDDVREILRDADGVEVIDKREDGGYMTPKEAPASSRSMSRASATTRPSRTACASGAWPTTCARARRSTPCRSPSFCTSGSDQAETPGLSRSSATSGWTILKGSRDIRSGSPFSFWTEGRRDVGGRDQDPGRSPDRADRRGGLLPAVGLPAAVFPPAVGAGRRLVGDDRPPHPVGRAVGLPGRAAGQAGRPGRGGAAPAQAP